MTAFNHQAIVQFLSEQGVEISSSELHGLMTGYLCANSKSSARERLGLFELWMDAGVDSGSAALLEKLFTDTLESLGEYSDFEFRILMPEDETSITLRGEALSRWCTGYLSGFGSAGQHEQADLSDDVIEAFADFSKIAGLTESVPDSEENESDLMEICEYVRISVLLIFSECGGAKPVH
jgi:uncharacterized protein YgfB (UPF0149 family)